MISEVYTATDAINTVHNKDFLSNTLPDKSVNLIIADPPYFEVKGEFDFIWRSFDDYLADVDRWARECKRVLADNGTLFWWGMDRKIAYSQAVLDKHFNLLNTLVWERPGLSNEWDTRRNFPERGMERLLMYANDFEPGEWEQTGWERVMEEKIKPRHPFANYLKSEFQMAGVSIAQVRKFVVNDLGFDSAMINRWLEGSSIMRPEIYRKFQKWMNGEYLRAEYEYLRAEYEELRAEYEELRAEYEELRAEYEELRRPFDNFLGLTDVLKFSQDAYRAGDYDHPTKKPEKLTRALILTCSRPGDLVLAPFSGSGTEVAMAARERRGWVGYDIFEKYAEMGNRRAKKEVEQGVIGDMIQPATAKPEQVKLFQD